jgi:hypothetical protein
MANWTVEATTALVPNFITSDLVDKIYFCENWAASSDYDGRDIYEYDISAKSFTKIIDRTVITNFLSCYGLAYWDGDLYALIMYDNGAAYELTIERVDGVNTFTTMTTLHPFSDGYDVDYGRLSVNDTGMVAVVVRDVLSDVVKYSTNGSSWSSGAFSGANPQEPGSWNPGRNPTHFAYDIYDTY